MSDIYDTMVTFFTDDGWGFEELEEMPALRMGFVGQNGTLLCYAWDREPQQQFVFHSVCPVGAPDDMLETMAEFLTRANWGLVAGNFEMDWDDGQIRYKTSVDVENDRLTDALLRNVVYANILTMDRYLPGITAVLSGTVPPEEAIELIEGGRSVGDLGHSHTND